jgi:outer membrane protein insertion porin family
VLRTAYDIEGNLSEDEAQTSDALGGRAYYMGRLELEIPTSASIRSMGLRPSAFVDVGSVWALKAPLLTDIIAVCQSTATTSPPPPIIIRPGDPTQTCPATGFTRIPGIKETFLGNSPKPRLAIGVGVNWVSPFGPFRIDIAKALLKQEGDDTKFFSFNVGTQF